MNKQPEALRVAENLVNQWWGLTASPSGLPEVSTVSVAALRVNAARLLREQHAEIERLKAERDEAVKAEREACREIAFRMAHSDEDAVDVSHAIRARGET